MYAAKGMDIKRAQQAPISALPRKGGVVFFKLIQGLKIGLMKELYHELFWEQMHLSEDWFLRYFVVVVR